jgi:uncharacterized protein
MALYVMYGLDGPQGPEIRKSTRPAHLDWIASLGPRVKVGGPMFDVDGATPIGSLIIIEAASLEEASSIYSQDPYAKAGLWARVDVRPFNWITK